MKQTIKQLSIPLVLALLINTAGLGSVDASIEKDRLLYENTADFVCGTYVDPAEGLSRHDMQVTFFNDNAFPVMLNNFLSLVDQNGYGNPELDKRHLNIWLSPNRGFAISCTSIHQMFFENTSTSKDDEKNFTGQIYSKNSYPLEITMNFRATPVASVTD